MALSSDDFVDVRSFLFEVQLSWYDLGLELRVKKLKLDVIKTKYNDDPSDCLREMVSKWLHSAHNPTWKHLADALKGKVLDQEKLAQKAMDKYSGTSLAATPLQGSSHAPDPESVASAPGTSSDQSLDASEEESSEEEASEEKDTDASEEEDTDASVEEDINVSKDEDTDAREEEDTDASVEEDIDASKDEDTDASEEEHIDASEEEDTDVNMEEEDTDASEEEDTDVNMDGHADRDECDLTSCKITSYRGKVAKWVNCDDCKHWFHLYCLGFRVNKKLPEVFKCFTCE